jgi:sigma-E factor negative regulatory protein RseC
MRATARVLAVEDGRARLSCETEASGCLACSGGRGCALRWLARSGGATIDVPAASPDGHRLAPGDGVALEVSDGELLRSTLLAYLPPLAGLLAGPLIARVAVAGDEAWAVVAAVAGLALGWGTSRAWLRRSPPRYQLRVSPRP